MKRFNRLSTILASAVLAFSSILALTFPSLAHAAGSAVWTGASSTGVFSDPGNWVDGHVPQTGDTLSFNLSSMLSGTTVTNDISNLSVAAINFGGTPPIGSSTPFTIDGTQITVTGAKPITATVNTNSSSTISAPILFTNPSATVTAVPQNGTKQGLSLNSVILSTHNLATQGDININAMTGSGGTLTAGAGSLRLNNVAYSGHLVANGHVDLYLTSPPSFADITVNNGGSVRFNSSNPLTVANKLILSGGGGIDYNGANWNTIDFTGGGAFTLTSSITLKTDANIGTPNNTASVTVSPPPGAFVSDGHTLFYATGSNVSPSGAAAPYMTEGSAKSGSSSGSSKDKNGGGSTVVTAGKGGGNGVIPINTAAPGAPDTGLAAIMSNPITIAVATVMCGGAIALIAKKSSLLGLLGL